MNLRDLYKRYRLKKTLSQKEQRLKLYIRPGYVVLNAAREVSLLYAEIMALKKSLR